jgi:uncharacterized protein (TIGR00369 family)
MTHNETEQLLELFRQRNLFDRENGLSFEVQTPGEVVYKIKVLEKHLSSPETCHGGAISGFMDCILGVSALSLAFSRGMLTSTVEFKLNFIKPAFLHDELLGKGRIEHNGKSLLMASGEITNAKTGDLIAKGMGTFNLYPLSKRGPSYSLS